MGLFDAVKKMANVVTGGGAQVYVEVEEASLRDAFDVVIKAQIKDADLEINRVYLNIVAKEIIELVHAETEYEDGRPERDTDVIRSETTTLELDFTIAEAETLQANESYEWRASVQLPEDALPTYRSELCTHEYEIFAGLDCFGNDPDSGWIPLDIEY